MAISNYNAYIRRAYRVNGVHHNEDEYALGQISNVWIGSITQEFPKTYFQVYNYVNQADYLYNWHISRTGIKTDSQYASYRPGSMYRPEKYYTWEDMVTNEFLANFVTEFLYDYNHVGDEVAKIFHPNNDLLFLDFPFEGKEHGTQAKFHINYTMEKTNIPTTGYVARTAVIGFGLEVVSSSGNLSQEGVVDGRQIASPGYNFANFTISSSTIRNRVDLALSFYIEQFKKIKFYLFVRGRLGTTVTRDGIMYFPCDQPNWASSYPLLIMSDFSGCSGFPTSGFMLQGGQSISVEAPADAFYVVTNDGGPEPNDPDERPDPYDPDPPSWGDDDGGDGDFDDKDDFIDPPGLPTISGSGAALFRIFNPTEQQLYQLARKLWTKDILDIIKAYFTSPLDSIIGLSIVPVKPRTNSNSNIHLGFYDTEISAPLVDSDYVIIDCGVIPITRYYGSYLDYNPYTKIQCYLPYIGDVDVDPDEVMNTNLGILYYVNVVTGDLTALITSDGSVVYEAAGNCARQLPLSQTDYSSIINTAVSAVSTVATAVAGAGVTGAAMNEALSAGKTTEIISARATANNVGSGASLVQDVMGAKFGYRHTGSLGTGSGQLGVQKPFLTIERPNLDLADSYKAYVGYPCNKTMVLSRCVGFTKAEALKLSIPGATDDEVAEISNLLMEGVIF